MGVCKRRKSELHQWTRLQNGGRIDWPSYNISLGRVSCHGGWFQVFATDQWLRFVSSWSNWLFCNDGAENILRLQSYISCRPSKHEATHDLPNFFWSLIENPEAILFHSNMRASCATPSSATIMPPIREISNYSWSLLLGFIFLQTNKRFVHFS